MKKLCSFLFIFMIILTTGCKKEEIDTEKPGVSIISPSQSSKIRIDSTFTVKINATDNISIEKVELLIDGNLKGSDLTMPYEIEVEKSTLSLGVHTLQAKAYDPSDNVGSSGIINIEITGFPPSADFTASETDVTVGESIQFTDQSSNDPTGWNWDFGDGESSSSQNPSHTYSNAGTYNVSLTVTNNYGDDTETKTDYITIGSPPVAEFTASETTVFVGESIQFTDQSSNNPTSWSWDFGDGNTSTEQSPSHTYSSADNYTVSLQVTNSYGSDTETKTDYITVSEANTFTDSRDGKTYNWVKIGTQTWMAENLAYLPSVSGSSEESYTDPYYYVFDYQGSNVSEAKATSNYQTYGVLYNWPAALTACPDGWHLPSDAEWKELEMYLGMSQAEADDLGYRGTDEGGKLKETGTAHWNSPNTGATNESGFTALPGGDCYNAGNFGTIGHYGYWWSATEYSANNAWYRYLYYLYSDVYRRSEDKDYGFSVRCLRD